MTPFKDFPKMARLSRDMIITEKIDGTNASIYISEEGEFLVGSRTRWITPDDDNHGFAKWAYENKEELLKLGKGHHFGEWWGSGINRGYGLVKGEKRFSLFNVQRWCAYGQEPKQFPTADPRVVKTQEVAPKCVSLVPILYQGPFSMTSVEDALANLKMFGSEAMKGFMDPEGVIVWHVAANIGFKKTIKDDEIPKSLVK
jgi:hypothetical protein